MNTPSGYTALDLIGFTDRGAYDSTAYYVKNDLTHDLSNKIWRCLIDDTHGVAPVEGVNWTLFIDSQTALSGMSDVQITTPTTGEALVYDGTASKWKNELLADVALSGDYDDLINLPTLGTAAAKDSTNAVTQGSTDLVESGAVYSGLTDKVNTSDVGTAAGKDSTNSITQGSTDLIEAGAVYSALADKANTSDLAAVATSGSYNDLLNKPTLGTAAAKDSTNAVTQNSTDLVESGAVFTSVGALKNAFTNQVNSNGSKNVLPNDLYSQTKNNISVAVNDDGIITLNNTANAYTDLIIKRPYYIENGTYIFSKGLSAGITGVNFLIAGWNGSSWVAVAQNSGLDNEFTIDGSYEYYTVQIQIQDGVSFSNTVIKPMLCLKSDYDLDPTYVPPAKTNRQLTQETTGLIDNTMVNGAVNMLRMYAGDYSVNGVTYHCNNDETVLLTASGNTTGGSIFASEEFRTIKAGTYKISGSPTWNAPSDKYISVSLRDRDNNIYARSENGAETVFTLSADTEVRFVCFVDSGINPNGIVIKPMLTVPDYPGGHAPYAKSNGELTEEFTAKGLTFTKNSSYVETDMAYATQYGKLVILNGYFQLKTAASRNTVLYTLPSDLRAGKGGNVYGFISRNAATERPYLIKLEDNYIKVEQDTSVPTGYYIFNMIFLRN